MSLKKIIVCQLVWVLLAYVLNFYSYWRQQQGLSPLSSTDPLQGMMIFLFLIPILWLGLKSKLQIYLIGNTLFGLLVAYGGVAVQIQNCWLDASLPGYASVWGWLAALLTNVYGVTVTLLGSGVALREYYRLKESVANKARGDTFRAS